MNGSDEELKKETEESQNESKGRNFPTQAALIIRALVGGYVAYLAYQIATSKSEITPIMWAAVAVFTVGGVGLVIMSIKHFICGEYEGGSKDA